MGLGRVLEGVWADWRRGDRAAILSWYSDDIIYSMTIPEHVMPAGGITTGRAAVSDRLQTISEMFETLEHRGVVTGQEGDVARGSVRLHVRHRATGHDIEMRYRIIMKVRGGKIVSWDEFHDVERMKAFLGLVASTAADLAARDDPRLTPP